MLSKFRISLSLLVIIALVGVCCLLLLDRCGMKRQMANLQNEKVYLHDTVETYLDGAGLEHSEIPEPDLTPTDVKDLLPNQADSLTSKLKAKLSDFKSMVTATTQTSRDLTMPTLVHDTVYTGSDFAPAFHYRDQWIEIEGTVLKDTVDLKYTIRDSLWFTTYWKRTGWFSKELLLDGFSADPHTRITGIKGINLDQERRPVRLSLGPVISYSLVNGQFKPLLGVGLQYNLIRF